MNTAPPGWGLNSLTASFDNARDNQYATFHIKPMANVDLTATDKVLRKLVDGQVDPSPLMPMQFFLRCHSCFRAASACAMAGQVYEATVLLRSTLESAAYGLYIGKDDERGVRWLKRMDSKSAKERVREEFGLGNLRRHFEKHHPEVAQPFATLYDVLVDFGGHPNEPGFSISTTIREEKGHRLVDTVYLHGDGFPLDFGLKNTVRVGLWGVLAFREIYGLPYEQAGVDELVQSMRQRY